MATQSATKATKGKNEKATTAAKTTPVPATKAAPVSASKAPTPPPRTAAVLREPTQDEIQARAFQIYVAGGCQSGRDLENWLQAEKELRAETSR